MRPHPGVCCAEFSSNCVFVAPSSVVIASFVASSSVVIASLSHLVQKLLLRVLSRRVQLLLEIVAPSSNVIANLSRRVQF